MSFGFGFGFPRNYVAALFTPAQLFTAGVNGTWYDPSDYSTLFQDATGTTPVTAVEQPVGLMLDKSKGLVLGPELMVFTSNPSIYTFSDSSGASVDSSLEVTKTAANGIVAISLITAPGKSYKLTVPVRKGTVTENSFRLLSSSAYLSGFHNNASPNKNDGVLTLVFSATSATSWIYIQHYGVQLGTFYVDNISVRELPGNHAYNPSGNSANFPVLQQDGTGRYYLAFNGVNQWLQTNSIDFTYGDKMFVSAGVRKLSDAARGMLVELSAASSINMFNVEAPDAAAAATYKFRSSGTTIRDVSASGFPAPTTNVVSGVGNISAPSATLRVNGSQVTLSTADQGTGNYGNYPLYIGARAGTSLWFNGRLYGLVVAGKAASASEIASTETWLNQKTGAY